MSRKSQTFLKLRPNSFHTGLNRKCFSNTREEDEEEETDHDVFVFADTLPLNHEHLLLAAGVKHYMLLDVDKV